MGYRLVLPSVTLNDLQRLTTAGADLRAISSCGFEYGNLHGTLSFI